MNKLLLLATLIFGFGACGDAKNRNFGDNNDNQPNSMTLTRPSQTKPIFHLRIEPVAFIIDACIITFTNDNWITKDTIMQATSLLGHVESFPRYFYNKNEAYPIAINLNSYPKCLDYNKKVIAKEDSIFQKRNKEKIESLTQSVY